MSRNVLILGAGLVARPIVRHVLDRTACRLIVASLEHDHARSLVGDHPRGTAREVDVADVDALDPLIAEADVVVSLVPYGFHPKVARIALRHRVPLVTTSYVSDAMRALDAEARDAGVLLLNECGLDPGLDHMSAMRVLDRVRAAGGHVARFSSCCGSIPAPEAADNPWRYKFACSPRGALLAARQPARFLVDGELREVDGPDLALHAVPYPVPGVGEFEMYPNRDALKYVDLYGFPRIRTMIRGTIRWPGWARTMRGLARAGLLSTETAEWPEGTTCARFVESIVGPGDGTLRERVAARMGLPAGDEVLDRLEWAGLFGDAPIAHRMESALDVLAERFEARMSYARGERDLVVQRHEFDVVPAGATEPAERIVSRLVVLGDSGDGDSATARTVSLPAAVAAERILEGAIDLVGVHIPTRAELYDPILDALACEGIAFEESHEPLPGDPQAAP
jgi:saccharopine dehydrogenase (NADP+, L-glutamate forming)/spermidine synthase